MKDIVNEAGRIENERKASVNSLLAFRRRLRKAILGSLLIFCLVASMAFNAVPVLTHSGTTLSAWAWITPKIDGRINPSELYCEWPSGRCYYVLPEWMGAARVDFTFSYRGEIHDATLYVKNDHINLYLALAIRNEDHSNRDWLLVQFDNNHNGVRDVGENKLLLRSDSYYTDHYIDNAEIGSDRSDIPDGTKDGIGSAYFTTAGEYNFEIAFPLDTTDDTRDFSLHIGSVVGFFLVFQDYDAPGDVVSAVWPSVHYDQMADIIIAGPPTPPTSDADLRISGIEVTQAIQLMDNSMPLVRGKFTVVRVYVEIGPATGPISVRVYLYGVDEGRTLGVLTKAFDAPRLIDRGVTTHTANFLLPMEWVNRLNLRLKAFVKTVSREQGETNYNNNWMAEQMFEFKHITALNVCIVPINRGTATNPDLPTDAQIADAQSYFRTVYPASTVNFIQMAPYIAAGHSPDLNQDLEWMHYWWWRQGLVGRDDQVYGFHSGTGGVALPLYCGGRGIASSGGGNVMSHEICHNWGPWEANNFPDDGWGWGGHVPFNGPTEFFDLSWLDLYSDGSIQEFGFDTRTMTVVVWWTFDFMTYALPNWISPYRWEAAFDLFSRGDRLSTVGGSKEAIQQVGESLVISGWVSSNGSGSLDPVFRLPGVIQSNSTPSLYALVLRDSVGNALLTHNFKPDIKIVDDEMDDPHHFFKVLPHINGTTQVLLTYGNSTILDEIVMSQNAPTVTVLSPNGGESWEPGVQTIEWMASDLDGDPLTYQVYYSTDNGTAWIPLSLSLTQTYYEVDVSLIPGSTSALFKVVASDGFNLGEDSSDAVFTVTDKPPRAMILLPEDKAHFLSYDVILLDGYGIDVDDFTLPETAYNWTSDLGGYLGNGSTLTTMLRPGTHQITLTVTDSQGNTANDTITITVTMDIEITSVMPLKTVVAQGFSTEITVTVENRGPITQTFNITAYANETVIHTQTALNLTSGNHTTLVFNWNTTSFEKRNYTVNVTASLIAYRFTEFSETIIVAMLGDVTGPDGRPDGKVDIRDIAVIAILYGVNYPDPRYNANYDIIYDGKLDIKDIANAARHFGEIDP